MRGGELVPRAERVGVVLAADALVVADRRAQDGDRVAELVRRHEGTAEVEPGRDGAGMICPECAGPVGQGPLEPGDGLRGPARRQVRMGEPLPGRQGVGVVRPEDLIGEGSELPPVGDGRAGQVRPVQALPGAQQERVTAARPQQVAGDPLEAGGARPQGLGGPRAGLVIGPCLQQRVGRRLRRPVQHPGGAAARTAAWITGFTRTVGVPAEPVAISPTRSRGQRSPAPAPARPAARPFSVRYPHAAGVANTRAGIPLPSRSAASASRAWAPPGSSRSACSAENVQVTARPPDRRPPPPSAPACA